MATAQPDCAPLQLGFHVSVSKDAETLNEDSYQCCPRRNVYAVCDGASISYDSALWSKILARRFCQNQKMDRAWLQECILAFNSKHDRESLPWAKQAAFDRGSFSSLLGVYIDPISCAAQISAVGDTMVFLFDGDRLVWSCPYDNPQQFDDNPSLLSTNLSLNNFDHDERIICKRESWSLAGLVTPVLLCMTDALGKWLLESMGSASSPVERLLSLNDQKAFSEFVRTERSSGRLRKDDSTLLAFE